jgi:hypothetical protein
MVVATRRMGPSPDSELVHTALPVLDQGHVAVCQVKIAANVDPIHFPNVALDIENTGNLIPRDTYGQP